jgi:cell division protein FtsL
MNTPQDQQENELQELLTSQTSTRNNSKMLLYIIIITCFIVTIIIVIIIASQTRKENLEKAEKESKMKQLERNLVNANIEISTLRSRVKTLLEDKPTYETQEFVNYETEQPVERTEQTVKRKQKLQQQQKPQEQPQKTEKKLPVVEEEDDDFDPEKIIEK